MTHVCKLSSFSIVSLIALLASSASALAQVGIGDLNLSCDGHSLIKTGRRAWFDGEALVLGRDGYYHARSIDRTLSLQVFTDGSALLDFYPGYGVDENHHLRAIPCTGSVHRYPLRYNREGFPVGVILPRD